MINILFVARSTLYTTSGGDTTQIKMTAKFLENLGVKVDIRLSNEIINYSQYDLIHFFNIIRPADILSHASNSKLPFVVSTIFVDYLEYERKKRQGIVGMLSKLFNRDQLEYFKAIIRSLKNREKINSSFYIKNGHKQSVKLAAERASLLLPNSNSEYKRFVNSYGVEKDYKKVVNAIDPNLFNSQVEENHDCKGHIICVGRIEGLKNQLNLIIALAGLDLHLTIIGRPAPNHFGYYEKCKQMASKAKNIHFIDHICQEELVSIYKAAKVHVLPSWFETTGLSSLEAGAMGCNLVVTRKGDTEEYFGDMAYYCEPDDINSIREAVLKAYNEPVNPCLKEYIINNYTWNMTAQQTLNAYKLVLKRK